MNLSFFDLVGRTLPSPFLRNVHDEKAETSVVDVVAKQW